MLQYILECIAFQLVFLIIYDFFLKRETFFQWNRVYLIGTYILSLILPWIKIEALKTTVPEEYYVYPEFLWNANSVSATVTATEAASFELSWEEGILYGGMLLAAIYFSYKLYQIYRLRNTGTVQRFPGFTQVIVKNSELAFSFFRSIFLGDRVVAREHQSIIRHELVHIEQRHSWDLLFFELMRIVGWFNPLVYVYQTRISELHEFIADSKAAKTDKKGHYEFLLSQVFQTENISFVNQFFKTSLIKKRIAMLQRSKSKKIWQLKYLLLVPLVLGMLLYTSSEAQESEETLQEQTTDDAALIERLNEKIDKEVTELGSIAKVHRNFWSKYDGSPYVKILSKEVFFEKQLLSEKHFSQYLDSLEQADTPFFRRNKFQKRALPSTARYKRYVQHTKAFQILDKNLILSIDNNFQNGGTSIRLIEREEDYSTNYDIFKVENVKDLTGTEVRDFNRKIDEIFSKNESVYTGLALTDGQYSFEISETEILEGLEQSASEKEPEAIDSVAFSNLKKYRQLVTERNRLLQSLDEKNPVIVNLEQQIQGLKQSIDEKSLIQMNSMADLTVKYNQLLSARKRLLKSSNERNPVVINLNQQIEALRKSAFGNGENIPFAVVEEVPVFPGCEDVANKRACFQENMQRHISKNFRYPEEAFKKSIQGRVAIMFTISETGSIENIETRGPHELLEKEAHRIIERLPEMKPGKHMGKLVNVPFSIPVTFKLQGPNMASKGTGNGPFMVLPTNLWNMAANLKETVERYNLLVLERKHLLKESSPENPVIQNLDQQLLGLAQKIRASGKYKDFQIPSAQPIKKANRSIDQDVDLPFAVVDEVPVFPGCEDAADKRACFQESMQKHISKNFRYPKEAQEKGIQGRVSLMFTIQEDGSIGTIRKRGPDKMLEEEAERIIALLPKMEPGKHKGKVVRVPFSIPITFKLQGEQNGFPLRLDAWQASPLIVIDGEESTKEEMDFISPNDIASINVLKDESAMSIYGEKGRNGVILIQTKKNSAEEKASNEIYKADTNTMSVTATAKDKNGAKLVSGTVTDGLMGLPGATIGIEGTERGVISDFDGKFEIIAKKGDVIVFQYIGLPVLKFTVTDEDKYEVLKKK